MGTALGLQIEPVKRDDLLGTVACIPKNTETETHTKHKNHYFCLDFSLGMFLRGDFQQSDGSGGWSVGSGGEADVSGSGSVASGSVCFAPEWRNILRGCKVPLYSARDFMGVEASDY